MVVARVCILGLSSNSIEFSQREGTVFARAAMRYSRHAESASALDSLP